MTETLTTENLSINDLEAIEQLRQQLETVQLSDQVDGPITYEESIFFNQLISFISDLKNNRPTMMEGDPYQVSSQILTWLTGKPTEVIRNENPRLLDLVATAFTRVVDF